MAEIHLTIITVTKNCAPTIDRTLNSVAAVKQQGIEYLIIDGASTDSTLEIINAAKNLVDLVISEPDRGIYHAMNKGVQFARGRYILFINGDDIILADDFCQIIEEIKNEEIEIICATTLVGNRNYPDEILIAKPWQLLFFNSIPHPSSFVRRDLLLRYPFREDLKIVSDYEFFLKAYLSGYTFKILPLVTALHHRGGASSDNRLSVREVEVVRKEQLGYRLNFANGALAVFRFIKSIYARVC